MFVVVTLLCVPRFCVVEQHLDVSPSSCRMDPDSGTESQRALSLQWKSYKLVQDPAIRRVTQKIYRYDGVHFSVPVSSFTPYCTVSTIKTVPLKRLICCLKINILFSIPGPRVSSGGKSTRPPTSQNLVQIHRAVPASAQVQGGRNDFNVSVRFKSTAVI